MIVLSSDEAVKGLMDKRSAVTSSRAQSYIGNELASGSLRILFEVITSCSDFGLLKLKPTSLMGQYGAQYVTP